MVMYIVADRKNKKLQKSFFSFFVNVRVYCNANNKTNHNNLQRKITKLYS